MKSPLSFASTAAGWAAVCLALLGATLPLWPERPQAPVQILFASGPDGSGTVESLVAAFNDAHRGEIEVSWREMPGESGAYHRAALDGLASPTDRIDVLASDVVWTAELARGGHVEDLTGRFYEAYERDAFLPAPMQSATYRLRLWGVPWYADAGLLYYRRDLLEESGFTGPPASWDELADMARAVMAASGTPYGFVFQGAVYEGGTANAAEFIWSAGGDIVTPRLAVTGAVVNTAAEVDSLSIGTEEAARGLAVARGLVADGISPPQVADFREAEALDAFLAGDAVFLRNWPYAFRALREAGFTEDQVGVSALPAVLPGGESASCLGGFNLMINRSSGSAERDAAWAFIRFMTDPAQQRRQASQAGLLPVLEALYGEPDLQEANPLMELGTRVFATQLHQRPETPFYGALSARVSEAFNRTLRGEITARQATRSLERELREILARNR